MLDKSGYQFVNVVNGKHDTQVAECVHRGGPV
jgi:hypothetical protein